MPLSLDQNTPLDALCIDATCGKDKSEKSLLVEVIKESFLEEDTCGTGLDGHVGFQWLDIHEVMGRVDKCV